MWQHTPRQTVSTSVPRRHAILLSSGWKHTLRSHGQQATEFTIILTGPGPNGLVLWGLPAPHTMCTGEPHSAATCASPESLLIVKSACRNTFQYAATDPLAVKSTSLRSGS